MTKYFKIGVYLDCEFWYLNNISIQEDGKNEVKQISYIVTEIQWVEF